ncbi:hypothetical protein PYCCODRAFT_202735 [Trametes coccinea BRFM310]|uniref:Uncharacterized protein n=1 Tax=Trametes coccinea (strain BRFM310) TaxID=1353009 RepID=A0A1Y2IRV5_TRAC3|nr:hypothetical protein PYCCODRAFT_202735 [Trametes coccinea BRFM310]
MPPRPKRRANETKDNTVTERTKPYPTSRPLGASTRINRKCSPSPCPSSSSDVDPEENKPGKSERRVRRDLGVPTYEEYSAVETDYLDGLDRRKKAKALISQEMFDDILFVLRSPGDQSVRTAQFRWWVRKMFKLEEHIQIPLSIPPGHTAEDHRVDVVLHDGKEVAVKENIYAILCFHHEHIDHGGRDRTASEIRKHYTWIPKELVAGFIRTCPTCIFKRTGKCDEERAARYQKEKAAKVLAKKESFADSRHVSVEDEGPQGLEAPPLGISHPPFSSLPLPNVAQAPSLILSSSTRAGLGQRTAGSLPDALPCLVPWYLSSAGPSFGLPGLVNHLPGFRSIRPSALSDSQPPSADGLRYRTAFDEHVRLPSIHTCGRASQGPESCPRINLPSLSQLLGIPEPLAVAHMPERRPLDGIAQTSNPTYQHSPFYDAQGIPYRDLAQVQHVPQIDPTLLPGGVHMLALAAECAKARMNASNDQEPQV